MHAALNAVRVLVVEDDPLVARNIERCLRNDGYALELYDDPIPALERTAEDPSAWDVVILDVGLPGMSGIEVLQRLRTHGALASVIMLTGDNTAKTATACMRAGAFHYLTKPFQVFELSAMVASAGRYTAMRRELVSVRQASEDNLTSTLVGTSPAMRRLQSALDRLAGQDISILIQGESGTGKEMVARGLHERGARRGKRFVAVNCGAIPETLIDSVLFGHVKGAFTGATSDRPGVFVEADGGTLFLDEIGDMPIAVQARLLRVLQENEVRAVGSEAVRAIDVRVIAASHVDLAAAVEAGRFRRDLFYRLNVVVMSVPPLRDRLDDVPLLAAHFLKKHGGESPPVLGPEALEALRRYTWPGNVRELENAIMHAIALQHGDVIYPESLPAAISTTETLATLDVTTAGELTPLTEAKRRASSAFEKRYLIAAMTRAKGSVSEAARIAALDRTNFRRLLQRHGIDPLTFKGPA
jgi:two-component system response regulator HydG